MSKTTPGPALEESERFRAGVGIAIVCSTGHVLAGQRNHAERHWQLPQGGLHPGESVEAGIARELGEEFGLPVEAVDALTRLGDVPVWLGYELAAEDRSPKSGRGQVHRWAIFYSEPDDLAIDVGKDPGREFVAAAWMAFAELIQQAAPFRREVYQIVSARSSALLADHLNES